MGKKAKKNDASRKRVSELITQYKLHPEFHDIYVEGSWDKNHVEWFLKELGISEFVVYDIDTVYVPPEMLAKHGFTAAQDGKKERVVTLAYELQDYVDQSQVTCIADRDYDLLLGHNHQSPLLLFTDFSCLEMYFMTEAVLAKFLKVVVGCQIPVPSFLRYLLDTLQELHLLRATNLALGWGLRWLRPGKSCNVNGHIIQLDADGFLEKYLNKGAKLGERERFVAKCAELRAKLSGNPLHHVSKDDLFDILSEILPKLCNVPAMHDEQYIARALAGCAEHHQILTQPMYASLADRLRVEKSSAYALDPTSPDG